MILETDKRDLRESKPLAVEQYRLDDNSLAQVATILRNLYPKPLHAVAREYASNAYDAHKACGNTAPFELWLPTKSEPNFGVRDFGPGLPEDKVTQLLLGYGASGEEKRERNDLIGGFGIGCKCAFAIADQFTYTVWFNGTKTVWICRMNDSGVGEALKMHEEKNNTEPSGILVTIPIKPHQVVEFNAAVAETLRFWPREVYEFKRVSLVIADPVVVKANKIDVTFSLGPGVDAQFQVASWSGLYDDKFYVRQGFYRYALDKNAFEPACWAKLQELIPGYAASTLTVPEGMFPLAPSRESLRYTGKTTAALIALFTQGLQETATQLEARIGQAAKTSLRALYELNRTLPEHWRDSHKGVKTAFKQAFGAYNMRHEGLAVHWDTGVTDQQWLSTEGNISHCLGTTTTAAKYEMPYRRRRAVSSKRKLHRASSSHCPQYRPDKTIVLCGELTALKRAAVITYLTRPITATTPLGKRFAAVLSNVERNLYGEGSLWIYQCRDIKAPTDQILKYFSPEQVLTEAEIEGIWQVCKPKTAAYNTSSQGGTRAAAVIGTGNSGSILVLQLDKLQHADYSSTYWRTVLPRSLLPGAEKVCIRLGEGFLCNVPARSWKQEHLFFKEQGVVVPPVYGIRRGYESLPKEEWIIYDDWVKREFFRQGTALGMTQLQLHVALWIWAKQDGFGFKRSPKNATWAVCTPAVYRSSSWDECLSYDDNGVNWFLQALLRNLPARHPVTQAYGELRKYLSYELAHVRYANNFQRSCPRLRCSFRPEVPESKFIAALDAVLQCCARYMPVCGLSPDILLSPAESHRRPVEQEWARWSDLSSNLDPKMNPVLFGQYVATTLRPLPTDTKSVFAQYEK